MVNYLAPGISDHSPLKVSSDPEFPTGPKPLKYFEMWEDHPTFKETVENAWSTEVSGSPMYRLLKKISTTKMGLKSWNKHCFGPVHHSFQRCREELETARAIQQNSPQDQQLISLE
ncbi:hypothetical protein QJS10_CPA07g00502 [Acorus calamus]|uniref:Uncharacterized protein n=1 Tax=Acorus calamus TaxID=4465 RepID=A0AAV9EH31_ACOCL|nr:hypothetical protein QJS10_CPA07g00502 [Acorus calamus]